MRKITRQAVTAFLAKRNFRSGNTVVIADDECVKMFLHGNLIASNSKSQTIPGLLLSLAGWNTPTTRERLNGICDFLNLPGRFYQHRYQAYFGDESIQPYQWLKFDAF